MPFTRRKYARDKDDAVLRTRRATRKTHPHAIDRDDRRDPAVRRRNDPDMQASVEAQGILDEARAFTRRKPLWVATAALMTGAILATVVQRGR